MRRVASVMLLVLAGTLFPLAVVATWARTTMFESDAFSERAVEPLRAEPVRTELARRLTEQLIRSGNQQAISFRPGFELAIEGVIDTDTFRSIFRNAVRKTHQSILRGRGGGSGLDLADSFAIITSSLQVAGGAQPAQQGANALDNSLNDVTKQLDDLGVWDLDETIDTLALAFFLGSGAAAAGSILLATDRRRAVRRVGWAIVIGGAFIVVVLLVLRWFVGRQISDAQLGSAIDAALGRVTDDLRLSGIWIAVYGVVVVAAAASSSTRYTPVLVWRRTAGWIERRRRTTVGTIALGAIGVLISIVLIQNPLGNLELIVRAAGLWIGYLAITEILRVVRSITLATPDRRARWPRIAVITGTLVVIVAGVSFAFILSTRGAARAATASGEQVCNGKESLCDLTLDQVAFPGTHNSMSSSLYPGFLFGEQIGTISSQLNAGVRALLIDTHYGVQSTARLPGANSPVILTDKVAEVGARPADTVDPEAEKRAAQLAARAPKAADAHRAIYLCHNNCELGAVEFDTVLTDIKSFLDTHPDEVLMVIIQDATTPKETAAAIEAAGLSDRVATLQPGEPLPTLGDLIDARQTLLVFAEQGAPGGPAWYHAAYDWFQETGYTFASTDDFNCRPNRGPDDAPLFLINHWVSSAPPDPGKAAKANAASLLERRIVQCIGERGLAPNIVAVDFAERGGLISAVRSINETRLQEERARRKAFKRAARGDAEPRPDGTVTTPPPEQVEPLPPPAEATVITELTGGDPARFCPALPIALRTIVAWAEVILGETPSGAGLTDLAYAPLLQRDVGEYVDSAPDQLAQRAAPILERANAAVDSLRGLGLDDHTLENLAKSGASSLRSSESPDGVTVEFELVRLLQKEVDAERLRAAAVVFSAGQADPATLLDLGYVPPEVGQRSDFDCAPALATI